MGLLSLLIGPPKEPIKRKVAWQVDGSLVRIPPGYTVVVSDLKGWTVVFDINALEGGSMPAFLQRTVMRIGIPFVARDAFVWDITRRLLGQTIYDRRANWVDRGEQSWEMEFEAIQRKLRPPPIDFGFGDFDYEFAHQTNDEGRLRELLATPDIRQLIQEQRSLHLRVARYDHWLSSLVEELPEDVAVVYVQDSAVIQSVHGVQVIHQLLSTTVDRLVAVGAASPIRPSLFW